MTPTHVSFTSLMHGWTDETALDFLEQIPEHVLKDKLHRVFLRHVVRTFLHKIESRRPARILRPFRDIPAPYRVTLSELMADVERFRRSRMSMVVPKHDDDAIVLDERDLILLAS